jgi:hypothetical protein
VGVLVLGVTHLGVGELAPLGDEDLVPPETAFTPRLGRDGASYLTSENAHLPTVFRHRHRADGACSSVPVAEHPQKTFVANAREEPLGQRTGESVPGPDHEPRVLDEDRVWWRAEGLVGRTSLVGCDLGGVEGLYLGDIRGGALELDAEYTLYLAALVLVRRHEDGPHRAEVYNRCALYDTVAPMQEVRVESLEKLEVLGGQMRLSANSGRLSIVFPKEVWDHILANAPISEKPEAAELEELDLLKEQLKAFAEDSSFGTLLEGVRCGDSGLEYDLVLRPAGLFAVTTGYYFTPVAGPDLMTRIGSSLEDDDSVEQAYVIGAVASPDALATDDDNLKCLSIRGRRSSTSRYEMASELWQVLSERMGWDNVQTFVNEER